MSNPLISEDRARALLGSGLSNAEVASAVGCEPSYISQLMANDDFRAAVTELRVKNLTAATERDGKIDGLEDRALGKMEEMIDWITKPTDMARVFMTLNTAKRRGTAPKDNLIINNQIVNLTLPALALQKLTMNNQGEVIGIEDRPMITMQPERLLRTLIEQKGASDVTSDALRAIRTREIATVGYTKRTDIAGNRAVLATTSRDNSDAFDI